MNINYLFKLIYLLFISVLSLNYSFAQTDSLTVEDNIIIEDTSSLDGFKLTEALSEEEFEKLLNPLKVADEAKPKMIVFAIKVIDGKTKSVLPAYVEVVVKPANGESFKGQGYCNSKGIFKLNLVADSKVKVKISYGAYMPVTDVFNIKKLVEVKGKEQVKKQYKLTKIEVGEYVNLNKISFKQGQSKLEKKSFRQLDELAMMMQQNPKMEVEIAGHTDDTGSEAASLKLSEERVRMVKKYLVEKKEIKEKRIKEIGYGSTKPIEKGITSEARKKNRRVEFKILKM